MLENEIFQSLQLTTWQSVAFTMGIIIGTFIAATAVNFIMKRGFSRLEASMKRRSAKLGRAVTSRKTRFVMTRRIIVFVIYVVGLIFVVYSIPPLRQLSYTLFAGAGIAAIIIGFATKDAFSNIISGIFIVVSEPYRVGDRVTIKDTYGSVEDITLRQTVIRTVENKRMIIPNQIMSTETIINHSIIDEKAMKLLDFQISYDSSIDKAREIILDEILKHPDFLDSRTEAEILNKEDPAKVRVIEHCDSGIKLRAVFWAIDQPTSWRMGTDLLESVKKRFDKAGIEIPFPYRTIVMKKPKRARTAPKKKRKR